MKSDIWSITVAPVNNGEITVIIVTDDGDDVMMTGGALTMSPIINAVVTGVVNGAYMDEIEGTEGEVVH